MHLMHMTSSSLDNFAQVRRWTSLLLSYDDWPGWLGDRCPSVGWHAHSSLDYHNTLNIFYVPHPGWKRWVRNSYWPKQEPSWLTTKALQNWPPPPPVKHLQNQRCAVMIENLPATGVVVPTTWRGTACRTPRETGQSDGQSSLWDALLQVQWPWTCSIAVPGKHQRGGDISISLLPDQLNTRKLPSMKVCVDGQECTVLIDSGCSQMLVSKAVCRFWKQKSAGVLTTDGRTLNCRGYSKIKVEVGQVPAVDIEALVVDKQLLGFNLLLGIDMIKLLGGVYLIESGKARFGGLNRCAAISIDEPDFSVTYDHRNKEWTASWKWANGHSPSELSNSVQEYAVPRHARYADENEILQWQQNGWLLPYSEEELNPPKGLVSLMAVVQEQKQKVCPVLDYRELNGFVDAFTANAEVCTQKLREWRWQGVCCF